MDDPLAYDPVPWRVEWDGPTKPYEGDGVGGWVVKSADGAIIVSLGDTEEEKALGDFICEAVLEKATALVEARRPERYPTVSCGGCGEEFDPPGPGFTRCSPCTPEGVDAG